MNQKEFDYYGQIRNLLIGHQINDIYYDQNNYGSDTPHWELSNQIHTIDQHIVMEMSNGQHIRLQWDAEFYKYGVGLELLETIKVYPEHRRSRVKTNKRWRDLIRQNILEIKVHWDVSHDFTSKERIQLPQSWEIVFENGVHIWIASMEIDEENRVNYWANHLTVFFDEPGAKRYGVLEHYQKEYVVKK